jgi:hypothetical protein
MKAEIVQHKEHKVRTQRTLRKSFLHFASFIWVLCVAWLFSACGGNESILKSGKETPAQANAQPAKSSLASDIDSARTAGFSFIYLLRRKDGELINNADRGVIRENTAMANRRFSADEGKAFIIGSNPPIPPQNMAALYDHFAVEDHSPPAANANVNSNK